jgi:hypothetical protein
MGMLLRVEIPQPSSYTIYVQPVISALDDANSMHTIFVAQAWQTSHYIFLQIG